MRTIYKNELPPHCDSWLDFVKKWHDRMNITPDIIIKVEAEQGKYYINKDFAKARAYDELLLIFKKMI